MHTLRYRLFSIPPKEWRGVRLQGIVLCDVVNGLMAPWRKKFQITGCSGKCLSFLYRRIVVLHDGILSASSVPVCLKPTYSKRKL